MSTKRGLPWWAWVPFLPILLAFLLIWRTRRPRRIPVNVHRDSIPLPMDSREADDLTEIKGIGLKSASVLNAAGIATFARLAATPVEQLRETLLGAKLRLVDPATWPAQAAARLPVKAGFRPSK
jgi:predicted flap endonuclease-1-like 5' DNA nuclease